MALFTTDGSVPRNRRIRAIVELASDGMAMRDIMKKYHMSSNTFYQVLKVGKFDGRKYRLHKFKKELLDLRRQLELGKTSFAAAFDLGKDHRTLRYLMSLLGHSQLVLTTSGGRLRPIRNVPKYELPSESTIGKESGSLRISYPIEYVYKKEVSIRSGTMLFDLEKIKKIESKSQRMALRRLQKIFNSYGFAITFLCPVCDIELVLKYEKSTFRCTNCGKKWIINKSGKIDEYAAKPKYRRDLEELEKKSGIKRRKIRK